MENTGSKHSDLDGEIDEIPEIDLSIRVRPYMYEPLREDGSQDGHSSDSESEEEPEEDPEGPGDDLPGVDEWCSCGHCTSMPSATECKCCRSIPMVDSKIQTSDVNIQCITDHEGFQANCLNRHVLEVSYYEFVQDNGLPEEPVHELYRYIAYRRFARWIWRILGKRNRRVLPACVVTQIRSHFPSQEYCGFQYP